MDKSIKADQILKTKEFGKFVIFFHFDVLRFYF